MSVIPQMDSEYANRVYSHGSLWDSS